MVEHNGLHLTPISLKDANAFVARYHRHHKPVVGHKFSIACVDREGELRGVAIVGRPVSRYLDDGTTLEVNRLCTDGVRNGCSMLYSAAWRAAQAWGTGVYSHTFSKRKTAQVSVLPGGIATAQRADETGRESDTARKKCFR